ncbi:hypothetical protein [Mesorhizobium sp. CAU 1741]|uniref:hypothetical protein n=1 Tax=Mesorhizobium sp. CAU 1741 TaxID=3140366 RepID=UPI00325A595D
MSKILAKAVRPPQQERKPASPLAQVWSAMTDLLRRISALEASPPPAPAVGISDALIDREGNLVLTMSDGSTRNVGLVVSRSVTREDIAAQVQDEVARAVAALPPAEPARPLTPEDIAPMLDAMVAEAVAALPAPSPGKDADPNETAAMVRTEVAKAVAALPAAKGIDGIDVDRVDDETALLRFTVGEIEHSFEIALPRGAAAPAIQMDVLRTLAGEAVQAVIEDHVSRAVDALPAPNDGVSVIEAIVDGKGHLNLILSDARRIDAGKVVPVAVPGPPGRSVASARIDDAGHLLLTMSDDEAIDVGLAKGADAVPEKGDPGRGIAALRREGDDLVAELTDGETINLGRMKGEDGKPGKRGKPGETIKGDAGATLGLINLAPADLSPVDLPRLQIADLVLSDGSSIRVLTLS